jgi:hypothetical protein
MRQNTCGLKNIQGLGYKLELVGEKDLAAHLANDVLRK